MAATHRIYFGGQKMAEVTLTDSEVDEALTSMTGLGGRGPIFKAHGDAITYWIRASTIDAITSIAPPLAPEQKPLIRLKIVGGRIVLVDGNFGPDELAWANVMLEKYLEAGLTTSEAVKRMEAADYQGIRLEIQYG